MLLADVNPQGSSSPWSFTGSGDSIYFSAIHPLYGRELFAVRPEAPVDLSGDYNDDGVVDGADFLAWQRGYGAVANPAGSGADGDGDGTVDADDLDMWVDHFGEPAASAAAQVSAAAALVAAEETEVGVDSFAVIVAESARSETARDALFAAGDLSRLFAADRDANEEWLTRRRGRAGRGR